jgi:hypothetical protein
VGSCWPSYELKGAFIANGRRPSRFSRPVQCVSFVALLFSICKEQTDVVCVSEVGSCVIADLNVLGLMAGQVWASARWLAV